MRALAPQVLEGALGRVVAESRPHGMQMLEVQAADASHRVVWVKCAWRPGKHGSCAVQLDFPSKDRSPRTRQEVINLVAEKAQRAAERGATDLLLLAADEMGDTPLAAFLVPISQVGALTGLCLDTDFDLTKNGNSPSLFIRAGNSRQEPVVETVRGFAVDLLQNRESALSHLDAIDDLDDRPPGVHHPPRVQTSGTAFRRDPAIRDYVLRRADGRCEHCGSQGFLLLNGKHYLEAHHIISLGKEGPDSVDNVIALCPGHHREAHYGVERENLERQFLEILMGYAAGGSEP